MSNLKERLHVEYTIEHPGNVCQGRAAQRQAKLFFFAHKTHGQKHRHVEQESTRRARIYIDCDGNERSVHDDGKKDVNLALMTLYMPRARLRKRREGQDSG